MKTKNKNHKSEEVEQTEFPGYPLYDPAEDIMNRGKRIDADPEDLTTNKSISSVKKTMRSKPDEVATISDLEDIIVEPQDESEITAEDLEALGPKDLSMDMGDDEILKHRTIPLNFSGDDLDIPGADLDDSQESIGSEDEENNNYSLGGDNHNDLEESH